MIMLMESLLPLHLKQFLPSAASQHTATSAVPTWWITELTAAPHKGTDPG